MILLSCDSVWWSCVAEARFLGAFWTTDCKRSKRGVCSTIWHDLIELVDDRTSRTRATMRLLASLLAALTVTTDAFSPASRSRVLNDLREMRMTGAGGAAQPDYVEGGELPSCGKLMHVLYRPL